MKLIKIKKITAEMDIMVLEIVKQMLDEYSDMLSNASCEDFELPVTETTLDMAKEIYGEDLWNQRDHGNDDVIIFQASALANLISKHMNIGEMR